MPIHDARWRLCPHVATVGLLVGGALFLAGASLQAQGAATHAMGADVPVPEAAAIGTSARYDDASAAPAFELDRAEPVVQQGGQAAAGPQRPAFLDLRYEEDWSVLGDPTLRGDYFDPIKYIPIDQTSYWSLGGELRERIDYWHDANFGYVPARNISAALQRYLFHADLHVNGHVRAFAQLASALEGGKRGGPWPTDRNPAEVHQAFTEFMGGSDAGAKWSLRAGRQEMSFGQSHFISTSDFYNTRRSFDGVRLQATRGSLEFNALLARPVAMNPGAFDDDSDSNQLFAATSIFAPNPFARWGVPPSSTSACPPHNGLGNGARDETNGTRSGCACLGCMPASITCMKCCCSGAHSPIPFRSVRGR